MSASILIFAVIASVQMVLYFEASKRIEDLRSEVFVLQREVAVSRHPSMRRRSWES